MASSQVIHFALTRDGARLAFTENGSGPVLVIVGHWPSHVAMDWNSPVWHHWLEGLSRSHRILRYDSRGTGLSSSGRDGMSLETWVEDLETIVAAAGLKSFAVLGMLNAGPVAIDYAVRHPDRVRALVLYGTFVLGRERRGDARSSREGEALRTLMQLSWDEDNAAIRQLWSARFIPESSLEQLTSFNELQRTAAGAETVSESLDVCHRIDVTAQAGRVRVPTLVMHSRNDAMVPLESGYQVAALVPGADFLLLDSNNHILLAHEPAWGLFLSSIDNFLDPQSVPVPHPLDLLTAREREILELIASGLDNAAISRLLFLSPSTVRNHITHVFGKLGVANRARAIVLARDAGIGGR
ncbi:alpha/beta fold hydrolase [Arthrobacter sp. Br18]|uniref:alpha/beta fold hydrolase n=1 Tax=Arthrobacter sp. Br18 TaxID=1312954 RepID=UPI000478E67D|nr:alpha/beta fold hydrolase [Arthrobacter sp. Br18]